MSNISDLLLKNNIHKNIINHATTISDKIGLSTFIVGGYVRDTILGKDTNDIDIMIEGNAAEFTKLLSKKLKVNKVISFEKFNTYRIPFKECEIEVYLR